MSACPLSFGVGGVEGCRNLKALLIDISCLFAAGYVFAYNTQPNFTAIGQTEVEIAQFVSKLFCLLKRGLL